MGFWRAPSSATAMTLDAPAIGQPAKHYSGASLSYRPTRELLRNDSSPGQAAARVPCTSESPTLWLRRQGFGASPGRPGEPGKRGIHPHASSENHGSAMCGCLE